MTFRVLGIHDGHNASACLLEDGRVTACIQEERLSKRKNFSGFPSRAIGRALAMADLSADDIDVAAYASRHIPQPIDVAASYRQRKLEYRVRQFLKGTPVGAYYRAKRRAERVGNLAKFFGFNEKKVTFIEHHACHAATAYWGSPWRKEPTLVLTNDGEGDGLAATVSVSTPEGGLQRLKATPASSSLGHIYSRTTFLLGLRPWEDEWKVMGLAPYAPRNGAAEAESVFRRYISVHDMQFQRGVREPTGRIYGRLRRDLERQRFDWIAAGVQAATEQAIVRYVRNAVIETGINRVACAGGVHMNVKANKAIMEMPEVRDLFVFPSCGDESTCIGAAYAAYDQAQRETGKQTDIAPLRDLYWGDDFSPAQAEKALRAAPGIEFQEMGQAEVDKETAEGLAGGKIVARCTGRMEWGARALGNRSILARADDYSVVREINMAVKKRDFWMPFAPVIPASSEDHYIVNPKRVPAPYMILSFDTVPERRREMVAAVHQADLTARPQVLSPDWNPGYASVLARYGELTGRDVLLNTSFNLHGYPIVHGPSEAVSVMLNSGLRYLALGPFWAEKKGDP